MATYDLANTTPSSIAAGDIINCSYTGSMKQITLPKGTYQLECWGAQGGNANTSRSGGKGGYSVGTLNLAQQNTLYLYCGGQGTTDNGSYSSGAALSGGFNGGGEGRAWTGTSHNGAGGGGGTDIRLTGTNYNNRIIVAGGGGGASDNGDGGAGGGTSGIASTSQPGTATSGSAFGYAAAASNTSSECGGGGGGWYGGYGGSSENAPGGGGSGYVYTSTTASQHPNNSALGSSYYLTNASTTAGNTSFKGTSGTNETGHSGNGYIRITIKEISGSSIYIKTASSTWSPASKILTKINSTTWLEKSL